MIKTMKRYIKKIASTLIHPVATRLGYSKQTKAIKKSNSSYSKNNLLLTFYSILKEINYTPGHIVDVGANHGTWTREALRYFPDAQYTLLEPQHWLRKSLDDILSSNPNVAFHGVGAGKEAGTFKFTIVHREDSCSFRYTEAQAKNLGFEQMELPVVTLNDFILDKGLPIPDIIKIDAEGLDLEVLEGASSFFGKTEIFMVEAGIVNKRIENNLLTVVDYMDKNGYRLFEITDLNRPFKNRVLWLVELVFVKKNGKIDNHIFY